MCFFSFGLHFQNFKMQRFEKKIAQISDTTLTIQKNEKGCQEK